MCGASPDEIWHRMPLVEALQYQQLYWEKWSHDEQISGSAAWANVPRLLVKSVFANDDGAELV